MTRGLFDALPGARRLRALFIGAMATLALAGCESTIVSHGHSIDSTELDLIVPGETTLGDLRAILGKPSFEGAFDSGKVYYLSEVMIEPPGGRKRISTRSLIIITLDETEFVTGIEVRDEDSGNTIAFLDERSPTPGDNFGVAEQIFSTMRRKPR